MKMNKHFTNDVTKHFFRIFFVLFLIIFVTGCGEKQVEQKLITCTQEKTGEYDSYKVTSTFDVYYQGDYLVKIDSTEVIESERADVLETFEKTLTENYQNMQNTYGGYDYRIVKTDKVLTVYNLVDYGKVDIKKLVSDDQDLAKFVNQKKEKFLYRSFIETYERNGATCK